MSKGWIALRVLKGVIFVAAVLLLFGGVVMSLWNALIPELFKGPVLSFWQAVGLLVLSHILFRGIHGHSWRGKHWRNHFNERLKNMTPEEREEFKQSWEARCGWGRDDCK